MSLLKNIEQKLLFVERKRLYDYPERDRIEHEFEDKKLVNFELFAQNIPSNQTIGDF